ncbi:MAG: hypothetical protein L3J98_03390 [Gammaproteobacteria bacterium]|nr:hypothetical protein [Gammaproteobacteria bacterium]MCF6259194.1 hypothetical protein [Gammaproteobacteria bacterium]
MIKIGLMKKPYLIALMLLLLLVAHPAYAALGLPENTAKLGYAIGTAYVSVDDPADNTAKEWTLLPLTLVHTDWLFGDIRYWSELFYYTAVLDATTNKVGQNVEQYGFRISLQKSLRMTRLWAPWFGVGIGTSRVTYTTRHTIDPDGFLLAAYPDREQTSVTLLLNIVSEWPLTRNWDIGAKLEQAIPIDGDISESSALIMLLYRY